MIYYCKHYKKKVGTGKALNYCLKSDCWALKICRNHREYKKVERLNKR